MTLPRILLIVDSPGWAHDNKSESIVARCRDEFDVCKIYHADLVPAELDKADLIVVFYWMQLAGSPEVVAAFERNRNKLLLGICSHAELEGKDRDRGIALLREYGQAIFVHNRLLLEEWRMHFDKPIHYTPNGVDLTRFHTRSTARHQGPLRVGWAGSLDNFGRDLRGFDEIQAACDQLEGVEFVPAIKEERHRSQAEMLAWFHHLDLYVCASRCEGTPNPCLEAAACGLPLVTTPVGNMPEFVDDGVHGFFIEPRVDSIAGALRILRGNALLRSRMGSANLQRVQAWSWDTQARRFADMFRASLVAHPATP